MSTAGLIHVRRELPVPGETSAERQRRNYRNAKERDRWRREAFEICDLCGLARLNVVHENDRANAPEGLDYYADVPFCRFLGAGRWS